MSHAYKSSDLIRSIKRRGMIPSDQNTFTDEDFLEMLNEEIQYFGIPQLLRTHEEYLVTSVDIPIEENKSAYPIPDRAIGNKLRDVAYVDSQNNYFELSRISIEDLSDYNEDNNTNYPEVFYIQDNKVVLVEGVPLNGVLRMYIYLKPNKLVEDKYAGVISSIDTVSGVITMSNFPEKFSNMTTFDFVGSISPNRVLGYDLTPTTISSTTKSITFTVTDLPSDLRVGDYVMEKGETIVPQLPEELHPILAQRVCIAALEALGDNEGAIMAQRKLEKMEQSSNDLIDNRVEGAPEKINNRHSPLRQTNGGSKGYKGRGRY